MDIRESKFWKSSEQAIGLFGFHVIALTCIFLVGSFSSNGSITTAPELAFGFRISLIFKELQFLGLGALVHSLVFWGFGSILPQSVRRAGLAAVVIVGFTVLEVALIGGWFGFLFGGVMPTYRLIEFTVSNLGQVIDHATHIYFSTFWIIVVAVPAVIGGVWALYQYGYRKLPSQGRWGCGLTAAVLTVASLNFSYSGVSLDLGDVATRDPEILVVEKWLNSILRENTGPVTSIYCDYIMEQIRIKELVSDPSVPVDRKALVTPEEWASTVEAGSAKKWNVLFVIVESLRGDALLKGGATHDILPNLNILVEESVLWKNNYSQATHSSYADISPISSQYPLRDSTQHFYPKDASYPRSRIYDLLKTQGYRTGIVSSQNEKWGNMKNFLESEKLDHYFHSESFSGTTYTPQEDTGFASMASNGKLSGKIDDRHTINEAIRWIDESSEAPFYLYVNLQNSHFPYVVPEGYERPFAPEPFNEEVGFNRIPTRLMDVMKRRYWDSLHYSDTQMGRLFDHLKSTGQWENTLVVVTGDTGQAFGEHGFTCHANMLFDEELRTPVVIRTPNGSSGEHEMLTEHIDVPPTILESLGLPRFDGFQGNSILSEASEAAKEAFVLVQTPLAHQYAIIKDGHKLIYDHTYGSYELYNLDTDPSEFLNVLPSTDPVFVSELAGRLRTWRKEHVDYYLDTDLQSSSFPPILGPTANFASTRKAPQVSAR